MFQKVNKNRLFVTIICCNSVICYKLQRLNYEKIVTIKHMLVSKQFIFLESLFSQQKHFCFLTLHYESFNRLIYKKIMNN